MSRYVPRCASTDVDVHPQMHITLSAMSTANELWQDQRNKAFGSALSAWRSYFAYNPFRPKLPERLRNARSRSVMTCLHPSPHLEYQNMKRFCNKRRVGIRGVVTAGNPGETLGARGPFALPVFGFTSSAHSRDQHASSGNTGFPPLFHPLRIDGVNRTLPHR